jgi:hypothetical protein
MPTITVATFNAAKPAQRLQTWLEKAGVPTVLRDQRKLQRIWFLAKPYSSFHLDVDKDHFDKANALLSDWQESKHALADANRCPKCNSLRIEYPHMTRKFLLPTLFAHFLNLLGSNEHHFYCEECHFTWRRVYKAGKLPVNLPHS